MLTLRLAVPLIALALLTVACEPQGEPETTTAPVTPPDAPAASAPIADPPPADAPTAQPATAVESDSPPEAKPLAATLPEEAPHPAGSLDRDSAPFAPSGMLVDVHKLYETALADVEGEPAEGGVADYALVTPNGVYAFIETPTNQKLLAAAPLDEMVAVKGTLYHPGRLIEAEMMMASGDDQPTTDLSPFRAAQGEAVTLSGMNKCQCGLKMPDINTSCNLGHLHHLEADDGVLYHYLRYPKGDDLAKGRGSHFKRVTVEAVLLPGQFLLVRDVK